MSTDSPQIVAIVGHADDPELLQLCVRHHLAVGAQRVFVSLNKEGAVLPAALSGDERVRARQTAAAADADPFLYFSECVREAADWAPADWMLFTDSDEFWLPREASIAATDDLSSTDLYIVERFNTPVLRTREGDYEAPDLLRPNELPLIVTREFLDDDYLGGDPTTPWIMALDAPKLMVRPELVDRVETGAHSIVARQPNLRWRRPDDLLIVHAPFTTETRFRRKVDAVRTTFEKYGARFNSRQAWHWRYWLTLDDERLAAEFRRQAFRQSAVAALRSQGVLASPSELFAKLPAESALLEGDALHEFLGRAIINYERPAAAAPRVSVVAAAPVAAAGPAAAPAAAAPVYSAPRAAPVPDVSTDVGGVYAPAPPRHVASIKECYFYHCMDVPGHGEVTGQWDLRGHEAEYLGNVDFAGRSVLEIGTASGCLGFWMERKGASLTAFDLDDTQEWDMVPFAGQSHAQNVAARRLAMRQINNAWWYTHERVQSRAKVVYGSVYKLDRLPQTFDIVTVNSVLLHLRDPFQALTQAAARSHDQIVVTDISSQHVLGEKPRDDDRLCMHFIPRASNNGPVDTWWFVPEYLTRELLRILGFRNIELTHHTQRFLPDRDMPMYTLVGRR